MNDKTLNYHDLRVQKTEKAIRKAFHELAQEKDIHKITVRELAQRAEINKTTFYTHYDTMRDLIDALEKESLDYIISNLGQISLLFEQPDQFVENLYRTLCNCKIDIISHVNPNNRNFALKIHEAVMAEAKRKGIDIQQYHDIQTLLIFIMSGLLGLLKNHPKLHPANLTCIKQFVKNGLQNL